MYDLTLDRGQMRKEKKHTEYGPKAHTTEKVG